jgi:hypothetical protein
MQWYLLNKEYLDYLREFDSLKRNQRLLITVLDEFIDTGAGVKALRGCLSKYANPELRSQESSAWASAVEEKFAKR